MEIHFALFLESAWSNMFALDPEKVTFLEKIIRPIIIYIFLVFIFRILGNRELAQLNPVDLVVLLLLSNTVQNAIIGDDTSLTGGVIGAIALLGINYSMAFFKFKSPKFEKFIEGSNRVLVENGEINQKALRSELLSREDLNILAHEEGFDSADDIEKCILDTNGTFLVKGKDTTDDEKFKKDVLKKIEDLSEQINNLQKILQKN